MIGLLGIVAWLLVWQADGLEGDLQAEREVSLLNLRSNSQHIGTKIPVTISVAEHGGSPADLQHLDVVWSSIEGDPLTTKQRLDRLGKGTFTLPFQTELTSLIEARASFSTVWNGEVFNQEKTFKIQARTFTSGALQNLAIRFSITRPDGSFWTDEALRNPQALTTIPIVGQDGSIQASFPEGIQHRKLALQVSCGKQSLLIGFRRGSDEFLGASIGSLLPFFTPQCTELKLDLVDLSLNLGESRWHIGKFSIPQGGGLRDRNSIAGPKQEILHKFKLAEKRPSSIVAYFFTGATLLPVVLLGYSWTSVGADLSDLPKGPLHQLSSLVFHSSLLAIIGLYTAFWLQLNLLQTLPVLCLLALIAAIAGYHLLSLHYVDQQLHDLKNQ